MTSSSWESLLYSLAALSISVIARDLFGRQISSKLRWCASAVKSYSLKPVSDSVYPSWISMARWMVSSGEFMAALIGVVSLTKKSGGS